MDDKNVSGSGCGDMEVKQDVSGSVKPDEYPESGALQLTATARQILASPRFPVVKVRGEPVRIDVKVSDLAITEHMIWLGAEMTLADTSAAAGRLSTLTASSPAGPR